MAYFRASKIPCGNKDQARARVAGENCGLVSLHTNYVITGIDIGDLAGYAICQIGA